ncbi:MAG: RNA polymerase sigma factor [Bacteroidota bacterium]
MLTDNYRKMTDEELLDRYYTSGDSNGLGQLLQRYTIMLLGVSMKYLKDGEAARDNVQQVFLKVITELGKYRVTYFKSWIYQIAKNHCLMQLRDQKKRGNPLAADELPIEGDASVDLGHWQQKEQQFDELSNALQSLSEEQRRCVTLFYLEKMSYRQIAEQTGQAIATVKSHIQNGKRNLRISLVHKKTEGGNDR